MRSTVDSLEGRVAVLAAAVEGLLACLGGYCVEASSLRVPSGGYAVVLGPSGARRDDTTLLDSRASLH